MKLMLICSVRSYPFVAYQLKYLLLRRCNPNELLWRTWVAPDGAASTPTEPIREEHERAIQRQSMTVISAIKKRFNL